MFIIRSALIVLALFVTMLGLQSLGRRQGEKHLREPGDGKPAGGAAEGAVFGLMGLLLAFTFSGAGARFDERRQLIVTEANAIGTAYLRIDLLPADTQPAIRDLFRQYADARIETYRLVPDMAAVEVALARSNALQQQIWSATVAAAGKGGAAPPYMLLLPALNEMIDITTTRTMAGKFHPPIEVYIMLAILVLIGALFTGHGLAGSKTPGLTHRFGFAAVMAVALYVIIDFEYPRLGLIRVDATDQVIVDVRQTMR